MNDIIIWRLIGVTLLIGIVSSISQLRSDIARINMNLNRIAKQVGVPDSAAKQGRNIKRV